MYHTRQRTKVDLFLPVYTRVTKNEYIFLLYFSTIAVYKYSSWYQSAHLIVIPVVAHGFGSQALNL